jgi:chorismate synthase
MSGNSFGKCFKITTFGESHGPAMGVVIDGVLPGISVSPADIQCELDRRKPGTSRLVSQRKEQDCVEILSGIFEGKTTGSPVALLIRNHDAQPKDYNTLKNIFRPGHADFTWWKKYGLRDWRGGGRASGRETVSRVAAGAIAKKILEEKGISVAGRIVSIAGHTQNFDEIIEAARANGDSVGGIVELVATGVPAGLGDPVFDKLNATIGAALLSIGGVKGIEFGDGFALAKMHGSQSNDSINSNGFASNRAGGILGGISNGENIVVRIAVKPTPSIQKKQNTINTDGEECEISIGGRHDPCLCTRIVPVAESMMAIALCDAWHRQESLQHTETKE